MSKVFIIAEIIYAERTGLAVSLPDCNREAFITLRESIYIILHRRPDTSLAEAMALLDEAGQASFPYLLFLYLIAV